MFTEQERARLSVGLKETKKAIAAGCEMVYLAEDAPDAIFDEIKKVAADKINIVPTMKELGRLCGIDVKASCAALRKN